MSSYSVMCYLSYLVLYGAIYHVWLFSVKTGMKFIYHVSPPLIYICHSHELILNGVRAWWMPHSIAIHKRFKSYKYTIMSRLFNFLGILQRHWSVTDYYLQVSNTEESLPCPYLRKLNIWFTTQWQGMKHNIQLIPNLLKITS